MIPKEVLKKIRRIQITTSRVVTDVFAGQYQSVFKGKGMEFDEVREYQPGDEIRAIDWNVTARTGTPFVKKFIEERELTVLIVLDVSRSSFFGTVHSLKSQLAAELCSVLAFSAIQNNDKVGLVVFTDRVEKFVPPRKGSMHALRVIREALYFKPQGTMTDISSAVEYVNRVTTRKTVTFVISDFYDQHYVKPLSIANKKHDIIAVSITDPCELDLPDVGLVRLRDAETGEFVVVDSSQRDVREAYRNHTQQFYEQRNRAFRSINVDHIDVRTDVGYVKSLMTFFRARERRVQ